MVRPTVGEAAAAVAGLGLGELQLHDVADPAPFLTLGVPVVWVAPLVAEATPVAPRGTLLMVDAHDPARHGGTGRTVNWSQAADLARTARLILAGGLTPENVGAAIRSVRPYAVDVASGVESKPGTKDHIRVKEFIDEVRRVEQQLEAPPQDKLRHELDNPVRDVCTGAFRPYGGRYVPETLMVPLFELERAYEAAKTDAKFQAELADLLQKFRGPSDAAAICFAAHGASRRAAHLPEARRSVAHRRAQNQ